MKLPRFTFRDTPRGTRRTDSRTGKSVWRKLGNPFPKVSTRRKRNRPTGPQAIFRRGGLVDVVYSRAE